MQVDPYIFHGNWTAEEKQTVLDTLFAHTPRKVNVPPYNLWHFTKYAGTRCAARRESWPDSIYGMGAQELADELHLHYIR